MKGEPWYNELQIMFGEPAEPNSPIHNEDEIIIISSDEEVAANNAEPELLVVEDQDEQEVDLPIQHGIAVFPNPNKSPRHVIPALNDDSSTSDMPRPSHYCQASPCFSALCNPKDDEGSSVSLSSPSMYRRLFK